MAKIGRNEPCPCGSGKKVKRCCGDVRLAGRVYTEGDRESALALVDDWIDVLAPDERDAAHAELWGRFLDDAGALPSELARLSAAVEDTWLAFDRAVGRRGPIADALLAEAELDEGERAFLEALRRSTMRLYEVVDVVPGVSLTLRDMLEGGRVTVNERRGSRALGRHEHLAARVVPRGPSGGPELEAGALHIPDLVAEQVAAQLCAERARFLREHPGASADDFYKLTPPLFHDVWAGSLLDVRVPRRRMPDGEGVIPTTVDADDVDGEVLARARRVRRAGARGGRGRRGMGGGRQRAARARLRMLRRWRAM